ncbi:hypothetical protein B4U80_14313 [Leptotrombidium deliense]|uniref:Serpin domain-containing protein n=1 Tax=Leptotrombidium deliense TaxID=299467 RepID=A0A443RXV6_9ACAR|nr:hypothetical protein B4U80_14313 [Leptotrombidium deliense]
MTYETVHKILDKLEDKKIYVSIPKFKIISEKRIDSFEKDDELNWMSSSHATFGGITNKPGLHFSTAYIVTSFMLHESGLKYTAMTAAGSGRSVNQDTFNCDHPFIFFVLTKHKIATLAGVVDKLN